MYRVLNKLSKYICFYISKNITSHTFLLVFKIVKSLECILKMKLLKVKFEKWRAIRPRVGSVAGVLACHTC